MNEEKENGRRMSIRKIRIMIKEIWRKEKMEMKGEGTKVKGRIIIRRIRIKEKNNYRMERREWGQEKEERVMKERSEERHEENKD